MMDFPTGGDHRLDPRRRAGLHVRLAEIAVIGQLRVLEAMAIHRGREYPLFLRVGEHAGDLYIDLADAGWRAVRVSAEGWSVCSRPPVNFQRSSAMQPLPEPERAESVDDLRDVVNVRNEDDFRLLVGWLVGALRHRGPYPILAINGEQGSSKSTLSRLLRALVDPNAAPIRSAPRDDRDLVTMARNSWVLVIDNLSDVPGWLSDGLCRLATGGGFSTRELYSDFGEAIFEGQRPIILNGIPDLAARADLADRCVLMTLPAIPEDRRRAEAEFWADFDRKSPLILGALLDGVAGALRRLPQTRLATLPRMADFALWATGAEYSLGWEDGDFMASYGANRLGVVEASIEADPIATAVRDLAEAEDWQGTATELLTRLEDFVPLAIRSSRLWPSANKLKSRLRRAQAPLRSLGVVLDLEMRPATKDRARLIGIRMPGRG
ncbi:hypothetical protein [Magnetospirillum moscoviense]|uniref:hypothetical protein n=1 Tax=Magnetospirillum moscoviense TaxID=1437059 RepID=UPI00155F9AA4|nr:hypothetical protein [Magnetospirillum moscoviense]